MHGDKVRHTGSFTPLSQVSPWWASTVQSLQTPCQRAPQAGGQAAWRQGPEAPVHTASHSGAAHRLDHWAAGTGPWGWLLPWGDARGRMTQRQTERDDAMSRISNSLTGTASNSERLTQSWTGENEFRDLLRGSSFLRCGLMWTGKILHSGVHRKCIMSSGLWDEYVFGHLCSASASVSCCGLTLDTRRRLGLFSLRAYRGGSRK